MPERRFLIQRLSDVGKCKPPDSIPRPGDMVFSEDPTVSVSDRTTKSFQSRVRHPDPPTQIQDLGDLEDSQA